MGSFANSPQRRGFGTKVSCVHVNFEVTVPNNAPLLMGRRLQNKSEHGAGC